MAPWHHWSIQLMEITKPVCWVNILIFLYITLSLHQNKVYTCFKAKQLQECFTVFVGNCLSYDTDKTKRCILIFDWDFTMYKTAQGFCCVAFGQNNRITSKSSNFLGSSESYVLEKDYSKPESYKLTERKICSGVSYFSFSHKDFGVTPSLHDNVYKVLTYKRQVTMGNYFCAVHQVADWKCLFPQHSNFPLGSRIKFYHAGSKDKIQLVRTL